MTQLERTNLIDQLAKSFDRMPAWVRSAAKHAMVAPSKHPETGKVFTTFREVLAASSDDTLIDLRENFDGNGDLLPAV